MWYVRSGLKVTGPFAEEQLTALRKRGQFTPIHQVSTDRVRWESAASLVNMLDAKAVSPHQNTGSMPGFGMPSSDGQSSAGLDGQWYYLDEQNQRMGPLSLDRLQSLIRAGAISPRTFVCARGDSEWLAAEQHPQLSFAMRSSWGWLVAVSIITVLVVGGIGGTVLISEHLKRTSDTKTSPSEVTSDKKTQPDQEESKDPVKNPASDKPGTGDPLLITSLKDEEQVNQAVGLVVCGERWQLRDGTIIEDPPHDDYKGFGTGTCFAVSSNGILLTNRHVVESYSPAREMQRMLNKKAAVVMVDYPVIVFFNHIRFEAKVLHIDHNFDLAILKIERLRPQPFFAISRKNSFQRGEKCFALGYPGVANKPRSEEESALRAAKAKNMQFENILLDQNFAYSYQGGEISRVIRDSKQQFNIEHSAKIFRGNSGGPLIDSQCTVIGINTLITSDLADTLYIAFATGQFQNIVNEFSGGVATWRD